jgi:hypothetical protein
MVFQLIYTCALHSGVNCKDLEKIAADSRFQNLKNEITGILLCKDGSILQVLEGEREIVKNLYARIIQDTRVMNPLVLIQRRVADREFPNWSMGYRNANRTEFAFELTIESMQENLSRDLSAETHTISRTFARVNGLD